jgi:alternate signal-mediated exported protein
MRKLTKGAIAVGAATTLALGGGIAWAAWSSSGSGSGSATSATSVNSTISSDTTGNPLYPGASTTFTVKIDNPNKYPVVVNSISAGSSTATGTAGACVAGSVTSAAVTAPSGTIAAGGSGTYTLTAHMDPNAADACQGQTFTLPLTATLQSNAS